MGFYLVGLETSQGMTQKYEYMRSGKQTKKPQQGWRCSTRKFQVPKICAKMTPGNPPLPPPEGSIWQVLVVRDPAPKKKGKNFSFCQCPALPFSGSARLPRTGPAVRGTAYGHWLYKKKKHFLPVPCPSLFGQHEAAPDRTRCAGNRLRALACFKLAFKIKTA